MRFKNIYNRANEYNKLIKIIEDIKDFYKSYLLTDGNIYNYNIYNVINNYEMRKELSTPDNYNIKEILLFLKYYVKDLLFLLKTVAETSHKYDLFCCIEFRNLHNFTFTGDCKEMKFHFIEKFAQIIPLPNSIYGDILVPATIYFKFLPINKSKNKEHYLNIILDYDIRDFFSRFRITLKAKNYAYLSFVSDNFTINRELQPENIEYKWKEMISDKTISHYFSCMQKDKPFYFPSEIDKI